MQPSPATTLESPMIVDNWQVTNRVMNSPAYGLLRLELKISDAEALSGSLFEINFGGNSQSFKLQSLLLSDAQGNALLRLHLVTHLSPNGLQLLETRILLKDGSTQHLERIEFNVQNTGSLASWVREDLKNYGTPPIISKYVDSRLFPRTQGELMPWFNRSENFVDVPLSMEPASSVLAAHQHLVRWGFTVLDYVIPKETIDAFRKEYENAIDQGQLKYKRGTSQRIQQAHRLPAGRKIWLDQTVLDFLSGWFRDEPCACQTLLYVNGSEQDAHQDTIHLTSYPDGYMCGVWVALQDIQSGSGELFVYPGSHRTPRVMTADIGLPKVTDDYSSYVALTTRMHQILEKEGFQRINYMPKAGQILVWHENLVHGGAKRVHPERERHSIVSHYFARGSVAYYDSRGEAAALERVE